MADEDGGLEQAKERCRLLIKIKSTVDGLLASQGSNVWSTYGGLARITDDLEQIFRHGLLEFQGIFNDQGDYTVFLRGLKIVRPSSGPSSSLQKSAVENSVLDNGQAWIQQALLNHCLSSYVTMLVNNRQHLHACYDDFAFLRSQEHVEALCICLKAVEKGNPGLLTQVDFSLFVASKYTEHWHNRQEEKATRDSDTLPENLIISGGEMEAVDGPNERSMSPLITIAYSDSGSSRDDAHSFLSAGSPRDDDVDACESLEENSMNDPRQISPNVCYNPAENIERLEHVPPNASAPEEPGDAVDGRDGSEDLPRAGEYGGGHGGVPLVRTKKSRVINKATLAHAALSAVLEADEPNSVAGSPCSFHKLRRTTSLNDTLLRSSGAADSANGGPGVKSTGQTGAQKERTTSLVSSAEADSSTRRQPVASAISDHQRKKLFGHSRSKSEQIGMTWSKKQLAVGESSSSEARERRRSGSLSGAQSRLASSLPAQSEYMYYNDPLIPDPTGNESYTSLLATQDFTSCELDKENAHFSISEALIAAIEQMKCDEVIASDDDDDDDDDEEIQQLKQEIERRRIVKKQEKLRLQPAFSDGRSSSASAFSSVPSSSDSNRDLSPGWEEITTVDEPLLIQTERSPEVAGRVTKATATADHFSVEDSEFGQSPPLSAEAVAKSLLLKFANKKHPAASELHWLVSYQDAPQSLLPLPETVAVAPDDALSNGAEVPSPPKRRVSLPCRIRGNMEWAPPRPQIIFHVHSAPRRKHVMAQQGYRCAGCGMRVDPEFMKRFRYCHYLGKYFCSSCHTNALDMIPARVVRKWDFKKCEISDFARKLLLDIHCDPLFNIKDLNPSLYGRVKALEETKDLRRQLHFFRNFARACRKAKDLLRELETIPEHTFTDCHLYSMRDLVQVKSGEMPQYFKEIAKESLEHIAQCQLCLAKGFICEYCKLDDIIFPFELKRVVQCGSCHASFHKDCFVDGKCPKCERMRIRTSGDAGLSHNSRTRSANHVE